MLYMCFYLWDWQLLGFDAPFYDFWVCGWVTTLCRVFDGRFNAFNSSFIDGFWSLSSPDIIFVINYCISYCIVQKLSWTLIVILPSAQELHSASSWMMARISPTGSIVLLSPVQSPLVLQMMDWYGWRPLALRGYGWASIPASATRTAGCYVMFAGKSLLIVPQWTWSFIAFVGCIYNYIIKNTPAGAGQII